MSIACISLPIDEFRCSLHVVAIVAAAEPLNFPLAAFFDQSRKLVHERHLFSVSHHIISLLHALPVILIPARGKLTVFRPCLVPLGLSGMTFLSQALPQIRREVIRTWWSLLSTLVNAQYV